jgi:hypothetical protein
MLVAKLQFTSEYQERTSHSGIEMLVAGVFTIFHTKCLKRGLLKEFWEHFDFLYRMLHKASNKQSL